MQEHVRQRQLEHQQLVTAAEQDKAAAQQQISTMTSDLDTAKQRIATLEQRLADANTAHAQALQVGTDHVVGSMFCVKVMFKSSLWLHALPVIVCCRMQILFDLVAAEQLL